MRQFSVTCRVATAQCCAPCAARKAPRPWIANHPRSSRLAVLCFRPSKESTASAGRDRQSELDWTHCALELKKHVVSAVGGDYHKMCKLQAWLQEAKPPTGESDLEHGQTETLAMMVGEVIDIDWQNISVQSWLSSPDFSSDEDEAFDEADCRMAGVLVQRLLQAYHEETGQEFNDEDEASFSQLHNIAASVLGESVDEQELRRLVKAFVALPFGGFI